MSSEHDWAIALKKSNHQQKIPLTTKKANLIDQINFNKKELKKALITKNTKTIQAIYNKLVDLKTNLLLCEIKIARENYIAVTEKTVFKMVNKHIVECKKLASTLSADLNN